MLQLHKQDFKKFLELHSFKGIVFSEMVPKYTPYNLYITKGEKQIINVADNTQVQSFDIDSYNDSAIFLVYNESDIMRIINVLKESLEQNRWY